MAQLGVAERDSEVLEHRIGYKQELRRSFSALQSFGLAFAVIGLVPSIASTLVYGLPAGPAGLVWSWAAALVFLALVAVSVGELASCMPTSGGLYFWTHYFAPEPVRNPLCFFVGYANTLGNLAGVVSVDYSVAVMVSSVAAMASDGAWAAAPSQLYAITLAVIASHAAMASVRSALLARVQTLYIVGNLLMVLVTCVVLPAATPRHRRNDAAWVFGHVENQAAWPTGLTFVLALIVPLWTCSGFESAVHISEEIEDAVRATPRAILSVCLSSLVLGWCCILAICFSMNRDVDAVRHTPLGQPMAQIFLDSFGKRGALAAWSAMTLLTWTMGSSILISTSRQVWAFSRDGALPLSRFICRVTKSGVPLRAVWCSALVAALMGLLSLINSIAASALFSLAVAGIYTAFFVPVLCRLVSGADKFVPGPFYTGPVASPIIAATAVSFELFVFIVFMLPVGGPSPDPSSMNYTSVVYGFMLISVLAYWYLPVVGARKWFRGPKNFYASDTLTALDGDRSETAAKPDNDS